MQKITGKSSGPVNSVGYGSLIAVPFPAVTVGVSQVGTAVQARIPLGLNLKIMAVSFVMGGGSTGSVKMNIVQGAGSYETAGSAPVAGTVLSGTWAVGDVFSITVGSITKNFTVTSRTAGNNALLAGVTAEEINRFGTFNTASTRFYCYSMGGLLAFSEIAYGTAGNSIAFGSAVVSSSAGVTSPSGATFSGGAAGTLPVMPPLDNSPVPAPPIPPLAADGNALFPVDLILLAADDNPSVLYPVVPGNFEAIWPSGHELTLRLITDGSAAGTLNVVLWAMPVDANSTNPQNKVTWFQPAPDIL